MPNYNIVILMGNLTREIEVKYTGTQATVANTGMAVNRRWTDAGGQQREETTFVDLTAWGKVAEVLNKYCYKGCSVMIEGRLHLNQWTTQQGYKRQKLDVIVESFQILSDKREPQPGDHEYQPDSNDEPF